MPKFTTVRKGDQTKQIFEDELSAYEADGWSETGTRRVVTETGERTIGAAEARKKLASGEARRELSDQELRRRQGEQFREETYSDPVYAGGLAAVKAVPLIGAPIAKGIAGAVEGDPGAAEQYLAENPKAALAGEVTSTILQAGAPLALAGKAGQVAGMMPGGLITRGATAIGSRGATKTAQLVAEGMADAAAWTIAQNHANAVIADKPVNVEMLLADLPMNIALGGALGGAVAGLGKLSSKIDAAKAAKKVGSLDEWMATDARLQSNLLEAKKGVSDLKFSDPGYAKKAAAAEKRVAAARKAHDDFLKKPKPVESVAAAPQTSQVREGLDTLNSTLADDIFEHGAKIGARKQAKAVTDAIASGKYLDGTADDLNKLLADYRSLGHEGTNFNTQKFKGVSDGYPEFAATRLTDEAGEMSTYAKNLAEQGVDLDLVNDPGSASMVRAWGANQAAAKEARGLATKAADEAKALAAFDAQKSQVEGELSAATKELGAVQPRAEFHTGAQTKASERAAEAAYEAKKFRVENAKPKAPKEPQQPVGLVAQLSDATLGRMSRAISAGQEKISAGIERFIKIAGKPRRGTVPAASAILGKLRFEDDLGVKPAKKANRKDEMKRVIAGLDSMASNPDAARERIHKALRGSNMLKPGMSDAIAEKAFQRAMFLHGLVPRSPNMNALARDNWQPSDTEIDKFTRIAAAAEDPYSILDDLESGRLTQEAVDTVKQLYPEIYHSIQMEIVNNAEQIKQSVSYKGQLQLGILFQAPTNQYLEPSFMQIMQENYAIRQQEQEQPTGGQNQYTTPGNTQKSIQSTATASQRLEQVK